MHTETCPNCGKKPPRSEDAVLCKECFDSYPTAHAPMPVEDMEKLFKLVMIFCPKIKGEM